MKLFLILILLFSFLVIPVQANHRQADLGISIIYNRKIENKLIAKYQMNGNKAFRLFIFGTDEFCINEFLVFSIYGDNIRAVILLFNARGDLVKGYCHIVNDMAYGALFVALVDDVSQIMYSYRGIYGSATIEFDI